MWQLGYVPVRHLNGVAAWSCCQSLDSRKKFRPETSKCHSCTSPLFWYTCFFCSFHFFSFQGEIPCQQIVTSCDTCFESAIKVTCNQGRCLESYWKWNDSGISAKNDPKHRVVHLRKSVKIVFGEFTAPLHCRTFHILKWVCYRFFWGLTDIKPELNSSELSIMQKWLF